MQIDHCLILAAGFGTRMGVIGQKLPKVLWPVFEKPLLELQVNYARSLGARHIYINLHFMGEEIEKFCREREVFRDVTFLWEKPEILDIGGAVHNLAEKVGYKGKLLVLNADQFFYINKEEMLKVSGPYQSSPVLLFNYWVNSNHGYNAVELDEDSKVKGVIKNKDLPPGLKVQTYTGNALIDLSKLDKVPGKSAFFDSVASWSRREVSAVCLNSDYWDFGTVKRFWETSFRILQTYRVNSNHPFLRFLVQERALKTWKINLQNQSYYARSPQVINLGPDELHQEMRPSIVMGNARPGREGQGVWWNDLHEEVN